MKKKQIKLETEKDIQLLKAIARTGFITENLLSFLGVSPSRLRQHLEHGNIVKKGVYMLYGCMTNIYTLSHSAKRRMRAEFLLNPYKSDTTQLEHDYVLAKIYMFLSHEEKESWLTETNLQMIYGKDTKTTDGFYISGKKRIGVEVISDSYSKGEVSLKLDFIKRYCDDSIIIHTHKDSIGEGLHES